MGVRKCAWRLVMLAAVTALPLAGVHGASAHTPVVASVEGTITYDGDGFCATGSLEGSATGIHGPAPMSASVTAAFDYCRANIAHETAAGAMTIDGHKCDFEWVRVGSTVYVAFDGSTNCEGGGGTLELALPGASSSPFVGELQMS